MAWHKLISVAAAAGLAVALAGCDQAEQGRILQYEKGSYLGQDDTPLSDAQRDSLRARALLQSG